MSSALPEVKPSGKGSQLVEDGLFELACAHPFRAAEVHIVQAAAEKLGPLEVRALESGARTQGLSEVGAGEIRVAHVGAPKIHDSDRGPAEVGAGEPAPSKLRAGKRRAFQVRAIQVGIGEVGFVKLRPPQIGIPQVGAGELRADEHRSRKESVAQVRAREIRRGHRQAFEVGDDVPVQAAPLVPVFEPLTKERFVSRVCHGGLSSE